MQPEEMRDKARELFKARMHCSQAVAMVGLEKLGLNEPDTVKALGAFGGALAACTAVYFLAYANGRLQASRLILGGVAIAYCLGGITSLIVLTADQRELANSVLTWTLGSLAGTRWDELGLPAALASYALIGWLLGAQNARAPLAILLTTNLTNVVLDLWFVLGLEWGVAGAAHASVIAEWSGALLGLLLCPDKEVSLLFCFTGYYPLLKPRLGALRSRLLEHARGLGIAIGGGIFLDIADVEHRL